MKFKNKMILSFIIILVFSSLFTYFFVSNMVKNVLYDNFKNDVSKISKLTLEYLDEKYIGQWNYDQNGSLFKGDTIFENNHFGLDTIKELTNCEVSIYSTTKRISTTYSIDYYEKDINTPIDPLIKEKVIEKNSAYSVLENINGI